MCPVTGARPADKKLGMKKVARKRTGACVGGGSNGGRTGMEGGARKGEGKREELCKRGGRGKGLREAEEAEGRMERRKEFETLS